MIGIELFSGAGGMALGAKNAGVHTVLAVENNPFAAETYLKNHRDTTVVIDSIQNISDFNFDPKNQPTVLFGGPPCQGFSTSNKKTRNSENEMNWLFQYFLNAIPKTNPDWIVFENVPGLKKLDNGFFIEKISDSLHKMGYTPNWKILNSVNFGVPQKRERLFIIASKHGIAFQFPEGGFYENFVSVKDAISDLPILQNGSRETLLPYKAKALSGFSKKMRGQKKKVSQNFVTKNSDLIIERYKYIKQGSNWKDIPPFLLENYSDFSRCHDIIYRRLKEDEPSCIISNYRKSMLVHPTENRGLSVREAARLQSFPDDYSFYGPLDEIQQQVGNAVPPMLAEAIFKSIISTSI